MADIPVIAHGFTRRAALIRELQPKLLDGLGSFQVSQKLSNFIRQAAHVSPIDQLLLKMLVDQISSARISCTHSLIGCLSQVSGPPEEWI